MTCVDVVRADDGYFAIYLDGELTFWGHEDPLSTLAETVEDKTISKLTIHRLGSYGDHATEFEDPPDNFSEIDPRWWGYEKYIDPLTADHEEWNR